MGDLRVVKIIAFLKEENKTSNNKTCPIGIQGQVWYLIVSIPDLCTLTYFGRYTDLNESHPR